MQLQYSEVFMAVSIADLKHKYLQHRVSPRHQQYSCQVLALALCIAGVVLEWGLRLCCNQSASEMNKPSGKKSNLFQRRLIRQLALLH